MILIDEIREFVDAYINPALAGHDGHLTIENFDDGILYVTLSGGCQGCVASKATLQGQVAAYITEEFPSVTSITDLTDHSNTENAYYGEQNESG